jgi:hypothetical protein
MEVYITNEHLSTHSLLQIRASAPKRVTLRRNFQPRTPAGPDATCEAAASPYPIQIHPDSAVRRCGAAGWLSFRVPRLVIMRACDRSGVR